MKLKIRTVGVISTLQRRNKVSEINDLVPRYHSSHVEQEHRISCVCVLSTLRVQCSLSVFGASRLMFITLCWDPGF